MLPLFLLLFIKLNNINSHIEDYYCKKIFLELHGLKKTGLVHIIYSAIIH